MYKTEFKVCIAIAAVALVAKIISSYIWRNRRLPISDKRYNHFLYFKVISPIYNQIVLGDPINGKDAPLEIKKSNLDFKVRFKIRKYHNVLPESMLKIYKNDGVNSLFIKYIEDEYHNLRNCSNESVNKIENEVVFKNKSNRIGDFWMIVDKFSSILSIISSIITIAIALFNYCSGLTI